MIEDDKFDNYTVEAKKEVYRPPSNLKFDESVKARFRESGFYLKWINRRNIRKRMHPSEGYVIVSPREFEDDELRMLGDIEGSGSDALISNGDLVLMKTRIEKAEARREYYQNKTEAQSKAIERRLRENALEHGGSKSVVRTGKNAHFSKNF